MHVVILGNGVTGASCALRLRELQPSWRITMVSGESDHPWSRPALMYIFMGHLRYADTKPWEDRVWEEQRIGRVRAWATGIDTAGQRLELHGHDPLPYDQLLLATGSRPNRFGWPGQDLPGVQGLYDLMDLHELYDNARHARHAAIVGGGLIGVELGEMLHSRNVHVSFLVRESTYWGNVLPDEESALVNERIREAGMELMLGTELEEILPGDDGRVAGVRTRGGDELEVGLVGLTAGVHPNLDLVGEVDAIATGRGISVDDRLRTSAPGVWAAGDCAEIRRPGQDGGLVEQVWYTGKRQGVHAATNMAGGDEGYDPGIWYNSAKFLDLEYQTYGRVVPREEGKQSLWWQSDDGRHGMRMVWDEEGVSGFNFLGLRRRHRVCERWIAEGRDPADCLRDLAEAGFDAEFSRDHVPAIRREMEARL